MARERVWRADLAFWEDGVAKSPKEGLPHLHLGLAYDKINHKDLAEKEYRLAIDPASTEYDEEGRSTALNNLGMLYMGKERWNEAEEYFNQAIQMRPSYATPYYGIGITSLRRAEELYKINRVPDAESYFRKSEGYLKKAIELNPQYTKAHNSLAYLLSNTGRAPEALEHIERVLRLVSRGPEHDYALHLKEQVSRTGQK